MYSCVILNVKVCAGPCPAGFYCPEGVTDPIPCPEHTLMNGTGARQLSDCLPCPAGFWCHRGIYFVWTLL